ncbi:hypothetical protein EJ903_07095 [Azospirillum griseum]|uniref:Uncharacterized protein n=1 Tax=Azospirillum griseum TaxID=2496639 RepID=A0A3S0KC85_9PROT|nr:hypothetical protein EJ903_07095 [Azospirillum griseum]
MTPHQKNNAAHDQRNQEITSVDHNGSTRCPSGPLALGPPLAPSCPGFGPAGVGERCGDRRFASARQR